MSINTESAFIYGHVVTELNQNISFDEGAGELIASVPVGGYSFTDFVNQVVAALNLAGVNTYSSLIDRATRQITLISDGATFSLLVFSGSTSGTSIFPLIGFTGADRTSALSYQGDSGSGSEYRPQFLLQKFVNFEDNISFNKSKVFESALGVVQTVSYGTSKRMECNITYATDIDQGTNSPIKTNLSGVSDLRKFLNGIILKGNIEFVPDILNDSSTFTKCILESTNKSGDGTAFLLKELYGRKLANYFETGKLVFKEQI